MKRLIPTLGLAGLLLFGFFKGSERDNILEDIFKNRTFEIEKYKEYIFSKYPNIDNLKMYIAFDLNKNGIPDLMTTVNMKNAFMLENKLYFKPDYYPVFMGIDKDENGKYELFYGDIDQDGYLESRQEDSLLK